MTGGKDQSPASYGLHCVGVGSNRKRASAPPGTSARGVKASSTSGRIPASTTASWT
ncbi:MAG TPA: hypothetical protein VGA23_03625 [Methylomirabilota bacterium]